jgi:hypothetical protein
MAYDDDDNVVVIHEGWLAMLYKALWLGLLEFCGQCTTTEIMATQVPQSTTKHWSGNYGYSSSTVNDQALW